MARAALPHIRSPCMACTRAAHPGITSVSCGCVTASSTATGASAVRRLLYPRVRPHSTVDVLCSACKPRPSHCGGTESSARRMRVKFVRCRGRASLTATAPHQVTSAHQSACSLDGAVDPRAVHGAVLLDLHAAVSEDTPRSVRGDRGCSHRDRVSHLSRDFNSHERWQRRGRQGRRRRSRRE